MKILFINACIRDDKSRTLALAKYFISKYKAKYNDVKVDEIDLGKENIKPLLNKELKERDFFVNNKVYNDKMFNYAKQFSKADKIIIASPCWDYSFPSILKVYIENICVLGITFKYDFKGSIGLSMFDSLLYITTVGGYDYNNDYIRTITKFLGKGKYHEICVKGLDIFGNNEKEILDKAYDELDKMVEVF